MESYAREDNEKDDLWASLRSPEMAIQKTERLAGARQQLLRDRQAKKQELDECGAYLQISGKVTAALEQLSHQLFQNVLAEIEKNLTVALQEVLEQPIQLKTTADWKRGGVTVDFWIERDGHREDIMRGQGGSVANVLSVGLRMFALTTLDENIHRRFLVLDEQDCWIRPTLVPRLVKVVRAAGKALGFQVIMISHHDISTFEQYADKVYQLRSVGNNQVKVSEVLRTPAEEDRMT